MKTIILLFTILSLFTACKKTEDAAPKKKHKVIAPTNIVGETDLLILNSTSDSIGIYGSDGSFKKIFYKIEQPNSVTLSGLAWLKETNEILTIYNHTNNPDDKIVAISLLDGSTRTFVQNTDLSSTVYADIAVLDNGDVIVTEANIIERFNKYGTRIANGVFPTGTLHTLPSQISKASSGGFLMCSTTTDKVQFFSDTAIAGASASSTVASPALALTTDVTGCYELENGEVAVAFSGTNDALVILNADLTTEIARFKNGLVLSTPRAIAQGSDKKIYVLDSGLNSLVILDENANYIKTTNDSLAAPTHILTFRE